MCGGNAPLIFFLLCSFVLPSGYAAWAKFFGCEVENSPIRLNMGTIGATLDEKDGGRLTNSFNARVAAGLCLLMCQVLLGQDQTLDGFKNGVAGIDVERGANTEMGTGFVVSVDGSTVTLLTARHLFYTDTEAYRNNGTVTFYADRLHQPPYKAVWLTDSTNLDVAVVKVENVPPSLIQQLPSFSIRPDTKPLTLEDIVHVFGGRSEQWPVTGGDITDVGDGESLDGFRFDGKGTRAGFSGAPVLDGNKLLIGVHLGSTDTEAAFGRGIRMSKVYDVLTKRLGVTMNKVVLGPLQESGIAPSGPNLAAAIGEEGVTGADKGREEVMSKLLGHVAGNEKLNPKDGLKYVWIPPGTFTMGCSPGDKKCLPNEKPSHGVTITKGFWMGQTQVTQEAYQRVVGINPSTLKGPSLSVENISWKEAKQYCEAVGMRLPTEAEWEYAARAGTTGAHPAETKQPNAWKLYDMLGSVWEWTADWYGERYYDQRVARDPQGPASGDKRTARGGSYSWLDVRVSQRDSVGPGVGYGDGGLRCAGETLP